MEVGHAVVETADVEQVELHTMSLGSDRVPPPTAIGATNTWQTSTTPAANAWAAKPGPATVMSRCAVVFIRLIPAGSKLRSMRVLAVDTFVSVVE